MGLTNLTDAIAERVERAAARASALTEPVLRLGVTGLSRAGKSVFITALVANMLDRSRMSGLRAQAEGRILAAWLQGQPDDTVPRFGFESQMAALSGSPPRWPESTRAISQLRLSLRLARGSFTRALVGERRVHIDIVDYPGEWLMDVALLGQTYAQWSQQVLARAATPARAPHATAWAAMLRDLPPDAPLDEARARDLAAAFTAYLGACRAQGLSPGTPGRFLLPGELDGSPILTFAPLPAPPRPRTAPLWREFARRYDAYRAQVVRPFFRRHFARIDRQVVLMDVLGALDAGPAALAEMQADLGAIMACFRPGQDSALGRLLGRHRVGKVLFAATRADHIHHSQHGALASLTRALLRAADSRAGFLGASTGAMAIASLRATTEQQITRDGIVLDCVRGTLAETGRSAAMHPGDLPPDPAPLLAAAQAGADAFAEGGFSVPRLAPPDPAARPGPGLPHIRLDRAAEFLIGDRL